VCWDGFGDQLGVLSVLGWFVGSAGCTECVGMVSELLGVLSV
jgi:hypothetical protein